jgi:hypothetical protein
MGDATQMKAKSRTRSLLSLIPSVRNWFAEVDQLASDSRRWHHAQSCIIGSAGDQLAARTLMSYLTPRRPIGIEKIRLGDAGDGGYVMLDDFADVTGAFSFGIDTNCSWDVQIADRGIDVYQYDHSVEGPPTAHPRFHFTRKMILGVASKEAESLSSALEMIPPGRLILKIDIEGAEWDVFDAASAVELGRFSQIVCEFHNFHEVLDRSWRDRAQRVLAKLRAQFDVVHVHANNYGTCHVIAYVTIPEVLEVSFANRSIYSSVETDEIFPTALDQPNRPDRADIFLGTMRYR